jgi:hypothetical protein
MGVNAHRALFSKGESASYLRGLTVNVGQRTRLQAARDEIRAAIDKGFRDWSDLIDRGELFEARALASLIFADAEPALRPKFRMQGSWSYHTLNRITWDPPQEIDLDDGVFLPVSFLVQNGGASPAVASAGYFVAIERILAPLCHRKGWELVTDKPSCVRAQIEDDAHIDLALYAIPDEEFEVLLEKAAIAASSRFDSIVFDEAVAFSEAVYPRLPTDQIMLAHRREGWKPSDPRKLEDWFGDAIQTHGDQLRRLCRYLKGWRDHVWQDPCRLSSIALMACVVAAYDQALTAVPENRDDLALQMVATQLPSLLSRRIPNPVVDGQFLDEGWTPELRTEFADEARSLRAEVDRALAAGKAETVVEHLRGALGRFLPDDPDLIAIEATGAPAILRSGILKDFADEPEARDAVRKGGDDRYG